jgi:Rrf2 family protein
MRFILIELHQGWARSEPKLSLGLPGSTHDFSRMKTCSRDPAAAPLRASRLALRLQDMIAQKTRYALRSLLFLAEEQGGAPVQLGRIAETQRVPPKYLELIMLDLKKAGLVKSARGPKGGYQLSRPAADISFGEIVRTMEGPIALVSCASVNFYAPCGDCHDEATCAIRRAFAVLRDQSTKVLDSISLAEGAQWEERLGVS